MTQKTRKEDRELLERVVRARWGRPPRSIEAVPAGLGDRRFYRLTLDAPDTPSRLMARIEPEAPGAPGGAEPAAPSWLPEPALEPIRTFLERAGLPVPRSYLHDAELGLDLLEDVGDRRLSDAPAQELEGLYREACSLVPRLQALRADAAEIPAFGRVFDTDLIRTKAWKWIHWSIPGLLGREATGAEREAIERGFDRIAEALRGAPRRLSHRDFKAENLHLLAPESHGPARPRLVMIDLQGAFLAPPEYDLVCLLYDLQVELPEALARRLLGEALAALPDRPDPEEASLRFDALALLRLCKDVAHVVHAGRTRGDLRRWAEIPRGLDLIDRAAVRLESAFPAIRTSSSVIQALTRAARSSDIWARP
jgi:aminoglycoside/choline kinase family phosphotransferase